MRWIRMRWLERRIKAIERRIRGTGSMCRRAGNGICVVWCQRMALNTYDHHHPTPPHLYFLPFIRLQRIIRSQLVAQPPYLLLSLDWITIINSVLQGYSVFFISIVYTYTHNKKLCSKVTCLCFQVVSRKEKQVCCKLMSSLTVWVFFLLSLYWINRFVLIWSIFSMACLFLYHKTSFSFFNFCAAK